jgi:hypothetical protein
MQITYVIARLLNKKNPLRLCVGVFLCLGAMEALVLQVIAQLLPIPDLHIR